jgi:hypothetical protein
VIADGTFILGPEVAAFERSSPTTSASSTWSASPTAPTRSRSRRARPASSPATRSSCRRSPSTPPPRRSPPSAHARVLRRRPRHPQRHGRDVGRRSRPNTKAIVTVDLFGLPAPSGEIRDAFGLPVIEDAAQALGASLDGGRRARSATSRRSRSIRRRTSAPSATAARSPPTTTRSPSWPALRFHGSRTSRIRVRRLQLAPRRDPGGDPARAAAAARRLVRRPPRRRPAYEAAGLGDYVSLPQRPPAPSPAWHLYVGDPPRADAVLAALNAAGVQARATTAPAAPPAGDGAVRRPPGSSCRSPTSSPARTSRCRSARC